MTHKPAAVSFPTSTTTETLLRRKQAMASIRIVARGGVKRVKLRARELARLRCQNLELDILNLRQEIATLETTRRLLFARTLNRADDSAQGSFVRIVREFFALIHAGYSDVVWRAATQAKPSHAEPVDMVQFMRACFDDSLAYGKDARPTPGGLNDYLTAMEQMSVAVQSPTVSVLWAKVRTNEADDTTTVTVKNQCVSFLTAYLLDALFPHLAKYFPWLRTKLLGRQIVTISENDYTFSTQCGRIVCVDLRIDQSKSILKLAESLEELRILQGEHTPRSVAFEVVEDSELADGLNDSSDGETRNYLPISETESRSDDSFDRGSKRSSESLSPMSLLHVLSPERDDGNQCETDDDHTEIVINETGRYGLYEWSV